MSVQSKRKQVPRCGYRLTANSWPCSNLVCKEGVRCGRHNRDVLAMNASRRRAEIEERIATFTAQRDKYDQKLALLRAELLALDDETGGQRVAEG